MAARAIEHGQARAAVARLIVELGNDIHRSPAVAVAVDDALAERVGCGASPPILRIWQNARAVVVPWWRLRGQSTITVIAEDNTEWPLCGRRSGGTAVAHGPGTLNLSLILPLHGPFRPSIDRGYRLWIAILERALREVCNVVIDSGLVQGAFCAGTYDVVAEGRKLAGIAQARRSGSVVVHGTILTHVERAQYLQLIETAQNLVGISTRPGASDPEQIASLHELIGRSVPAYELARAISRAAAGRRDQFACHWEQVSLVELARARQVAEGTELNLKKN